MVYKHKFKYFQFLTIILAIVFSFNLVFKPLISSSQQISSPQMEVQLWDNLGNYHHPISTSSKLAQRYFDQGLTLAYGFNHAEAKQVQTQFEEAWQYADVNLVNR